MSQSSAPSAPNSHLSPAGLGTSINPSKYTHNGRPLPPGNRPPQDERAVPGSTALPSFAAMTGTSERRSDQMSKTSPSARRSTGLHSLLNPSNTPQPDQNHVVHTPDTRVGPFPPQNAAPPPALSSPRGRKRGDSHSSSVETEIHANPRPGRRLLTPKSPLRAASLGTHRSPSIGVARSARAPLNAPDGRTYTIEPGNHPDSAVPPVPPLPITRPSLPAIQTTNQENRGSRPNPSTSGVSFAPKSTQPQSASSVAGPPAFYGPSRTDSPSYQQGRLSAGQTPTINPDGSSGYPIMRTQGMGQGPQHVQSGWKMALETQQGREVVDINIDYQQASKVADEKRKRNAGASARFRARRKEKEKEASQMIAGLQQELNEMTEQRDFYLSERNFFRDFVARSSIGPPPARPPSPHLRRGHPMVLQLSDGSQSLDYRHQETPELPAQRRRTGDFQPSFAPSPGAHPYNTPYPGIAAPYGHQSQPSGSIYNDSRAGPSSQPPPAPSRPHEMDPYRREVDRWNPPQL